MCAGGQESEKLQLEGEKRGAVEKGRRGRVSRGERDGGSAIRSSLDVAKVARVSGIIGAPMIDIVGIVVSSEGRATGVGDHLPVLVRRGAQWVGLNFSPPPFIYPRGGVAKNTETERRGFTEPGEHACRGQSLPQAH